MKVFIETYRGWDISFDTENENFYCHSDQWDRDATKKSFAVTKKFIDDFIKDNQTFRPFFVESKPNTFRSVTLKIIGLRKDGRFIYEDSEGEKKQLSDYNEKDYILVNPDNEVHQAEVAVLDAKIEELRLERKGVMEKITGVELTDYKQQLLAL